MPACCSRPARCTCAGACGSADGAGMSGTRARRAARLRRRCPRAHRRRPVGLGTRLAQALARQGARGRAARHRPTRWPRSCAPARRTARADRAAGRQYRPGRRAACPMPAARRCCCQPDAHEPHPRDRPRQPHADGRGRLRAAGGAAGRRRRRPAVPAEPGRRGQLHDRRQPGHQRRRHPGAALRQCARAVPRASRR